MTLKSFFDAVSPLKEATWKEIEPQAGLDRGSARRARGRPRRRVRPPVVSR